MPSRASAASGQGPATGEARSSAILLSPDAGLIALAAIVGVAAGGGHSSIGRALECGSKGRGFDPRWPPHLPLDTP